VGLLGIRKVRALKRNNDVEGLITVLLDKSMSGPERRAAAVYLGDLGDARAVHPLITTLKDHVVRGLSAQALGNIGDHRAVFPLRTLFSTTGNDLVRLRAENAVKQMANRDGDAIRIAFEAQSERIAAGVDEFAARAASRVDDWIDCPICGGAFEERAPRAAHCSYCGFYFTDSGSVPVVSFRKETMGVLEGSNRHMFPKEYIASLGFTPIGLHIGPAGLFPVPLAWILIDDYEAEPHQTLSLATALLDSVAKRGHPAWEATATTINQALDSVAKRGHPA